MIRIADDFQSIRKELERVEAEKKAAIEKKPIEEPQYQTFWESHIAPAIDCAFSPSDLNSACRSWMIENRRAFDLPDLRGNVSHG